MDISGLVLNAITAFVIPFVIQLLKKINLSTKAAPWVALVLAIAVVAVAKAFAGATLDFSTVMLIIAQGLGVGAVSVFGYDIWKLAQPTETK